MPSRKEIIIPTDKFIKPVIRFYKRIFSGSTLKRIKEPKILVSLFLASIMIFSILGFMMSYQTDTGTRAIEYNGYKLEQLYDGIQIKVNNQKIMLTNFPEQVNHINLTPKVKHLLKNAQVFSITYDPETEYNEYLAEQQYDLSQNLEKIEKYTIAGIANNTEYPSIPQITCQNATPSLPVILFKEANITHIELNNNCIIANIGNINDAYMVGDLLFYQIAGIME